MAKKTLFYTAAEINERLGMVTKLRKLQSLTKTPNAYLYEAVFADYDKDKAYEYFSSTPVPAGACSAVRSGNFYGRNLDWIYDNSVEFVFKTPHTSTRYATIAIAGCIASLTKDVMQDVIDGDAYPEALDIVPWAVVDGINEYGVVCNTNVVPSDKEGTPTVPLVSKKDSLYTSMVVRYVLDNFKTAQEAVEYLRDYVEIKTSPKIQAMDYEAHFMVADANNTYVVECVEGEVRIIEANIMTNFHLDGVTPNADGTVYTNADAPTHLASSNGITEHGSGLERYNIIVEALASLNGEIDKAGMRSLMTSLYYTKAYTEGEWYSEFTGIEGLTVDTPATDETMIAVVEGAQAIYAATTRDKGDTWHTVHSAVYDIKNRVMYIVPQEGNKEFMFSFDYISKDAYDAKVAKLETRLKDLEDALGLANFSGW